MTPQKNPKFQQLGYTLNSLHLFWLAAILRRVAFRFTAPDYYPYAYPEQVGYLGGYQTARLGCLAFKRNDNTLQFRW